MCTRIQPHSTQVLEPQVPISIDLCTIEPQSQIRGPSQVRGQQLDSGVKPDFAYRLQNPRVIRTIQSFLIRSTFSGDESILPIRTRS